MAKKEEIDKSVIEIREAVKAKKLVIGTESVLTGMKLGKVSKVFLTSNCPDEVKSEVDSLSKLSGIDVVSVKYANDELGTICKKPFSISVLALSKGG